MQMKKFNVIGYTPVCVKISGIAADSVQGAIDAFDAKVSHLLEDLFDREAADDSQMKAMGISSIMASGDGFECFLVDPLLANGEPDYDRSHHYDAEGKRVDFYGAPAGDKAAKMDAATLFFAELSASVQSLSEISRKYGDLALVDLFRLQNMILQGEGTVSDLDGSIRQIVESLPSGKLWVKFVEPALEKSSTSSEDPAIQEMREHCTECGVELEIGQIGLCDDCQSNDSQGFTNHYRCSCGEEWEDYADCACNDRCPSCNKEIEPYMSDDGSMTAADVEQAINSFHKEHGEIFFGDVTRCMGRAEILALYDAVEVDGVRADSGVYPPPQGDNLERDNDNPTFFSVYLHLIEGGCECVADMPTREQADAYADVLRARYGLK